jgi:sulfite reductase (NADPH) flavoprotein alpha-component
MTSQLLYRLHWLTGLSAGIVLAIVGVTGAILSFQDPLLRWMNPRLLEIPAQTAAPLSAAEILARIDAAAPEMRITALTVQRDSRRAARVMFASRESRYVDPYSGRMLAEPRGAGFFRLATRMHRWLGAGEVGKQVVGASTLALVLLCLSGLYLRWPRGALDWRRWLSLRWSSKGRRFLSQLHAVLGTWLLLAYLLMGLTGLYWSYDWYRAALFALSGAPRPTERAGRPQAGRAPDIALAWKAFDREASSYSIATLRLPGRSSQPLQVDYLEPDSPHDRAYNRIVLDTTSGAVLGHERYADKATGARLMSSIFALHSGRFFGLPGVIALMVASLLMPFFAVTGWMMYLFRRRARRNRCANALPAPAA